MPLIATAAIVRAADAPVTVEPVELDPPGSGEVLVRLLASGICHSDLHYKRGTVGDEFPFVLNTGRTVEHWHTRTKTGKVPILERLSPHAWVEMNPRDARALRLKPQDRVDIVSRRGRVSGVELRVTETIAPGQLFVPFHYVEANANQVTQSAFDPFSREPNYKQSAVRIERPDRVDGRSRAKGAA